MLLNLKLIFFLISIPCIISFNIDGSGYKKLTPTPVEGTPPTNHISFYGQDINLKKESSNQKLLTIGAPRSSLPLNNGDSPSNLKDSGDIFQCDIGHIFQPDISLPKCEMISPYKRAGDGFGLSLIRSPYDKKMAVSLNRLYDCDGRDYTQPGYLFTSSNGKRWEILQPTESVARSECFKIAMVDLIFVLDGSGSVREHNFELMLKWTKSVAHSLMESIGRDLRIGVIQYSSSPDVEIPLTKFETEQEFDNKVTTKYQNGGATYTGDAMAKVGELVAAPKPIQLGDYQNIMILLTDGASSQKDNILIREATELQKAGVKSFAVGVAGAIVNQLKIITNGDTSRVFSVTDFALLQNIVDELQTKITASLEGSATSAGTGRNFSLAQFGFSSTGIKKRPQENGRLLLGAVGAYDWSGTVAKYDNAGDKEADIPNYAEVQKVLPNRTKESYLGYSVTTGKYNGGSVDYAASGAPRYWMRGAVVVYKPTDSSALFDDAVTINPHESHQQFGSYFGGALLSMDLNNDGKDDLLVAAPLYIGIESDEGRVFVYITDSSSQNVRLWAAASYKPVELKGRGESGARFGTAMASAGDLNKDGFNDVIIGAPLTEDGRGAVYVYHGSADGIVSTPRQRIAASDVQGATLRYFGQSLQGGVDLDGNQYPDVAVGAPRSDTIAIFRSRPVATFATTVTFTKAKIDIFNCLEQTNRQCQNLTVCITISGEGVEPTATVDLKIRLDPTFGRLQFRTRADSSNGQLEQSFLNKTLTKGEQLCWPEKLYLKSKIDNYNDAATAILEYALTKEHTAKPLSSISDPSKPHSQQAEFTFEKKCAGKAICEYDLDLKSKLVLPDSKLESGADLTNGASRLVVSSETKETIIVQVNLTNTQQSAFDAQVVVEYSPQLSWNEITDVTSSYAKHPTCMQDRQPVVAGTNSSTKVIQYEYDEKRGNIMPKNHWCAFKIKLTWDKLKGNGNLSEVFINLNAGTLNSQNDSVDVNPANNVKKQEIPVVYKSNIDGKRLRGEDIVQLNVTETNSTISHVKEISKNFVQVRYEIFGRGYSNIPLSHISITYPAKFDDGLYLLYLYDYTCMTRETPDQKTKCTCDTSVVNRLGLATEKTGVNATTSNTTITPNPKPFTLSEIDCSNATTASKMCETLRCRVENLVESQKVSVEARFRVWIPTFNFIKNKTEKTVMKVDFNFNSADSPLVLNKNGEKTITYVGQNEMIAELFRAPTEIQQSNQIWIYIVAGIAGVLLLLLAVFILYKCGFFKSKYAQKKEELEWQEADGPEEAT